MPKIRQHESVGTEYLHASRRLLVLRHDIPASADDLFRCLADADSWTRWFGFDAVTYTSDEPHGVGTTRTVQVGRNSIEEEFLIWDPGRQLCFRIERSTLPIAAMVEDYRIEKVDDDRCVLEWTVALTGRPGLISPLLRVVLRVQGQRAFRKLAHHVQIERARYRSH